MVKSVINGDLAFGSRWFDDNDIVLNPEKYKSNPILPENCSSDLSFSISVVQVPVVNHSEILSLILQNLLNFSKHIGKIT